MNVIVLMFFCIVCGLFLAFGTDVLQFILNIIGSFERLSWFSLVGTAILVAYWLFCYFKLYHQANTYVNVETVEEKNSVKIGKKPLIFGMFLTMVWVILFVTTDLSASWYESFVAWQIENQVVLEICEKIGHLLFAFAGGILVSTLCVKKSHGVTSKKGAPKEKK